MTTKRPRRSRKSQRRVGGTRSRKEQPISIVAIDGETLHVTTPYNAKYVEAIKNTLPRKSRRWNPTLKVWAIEAQYKTRVEHLIKTYFGDSIVIKDESSPLQQAVFSASQLAQDMLQVAKNDLAKNIDPKNLLF